MATIKVPFPFSVADAGMLQTLLGGGGTVPTPTPTPTPGPGPTPSPIDKNFPANPADAPFPSPAGSTQTFYLAPGAARGSLGGVPYMRDATGNIVLMALTQSGDWPDYIVAEVTPDRSVAVFVNGGSQAHTWGAHSSTPPALLQMGADGRVYVTNQNSTVTQALSGGGWNNATMPSGPPPAPGMLPPLPTPSAIAPGSSGRVIMCGAGQQIATLSAAINGLTDANAGDTIQVVPGAVTYTDVPGHGISVPVLIDLGGNTWDATGKDAMLPFQGAGFLVPATDCIIRNGAITGVGMQQTGGNLMSAIRQDSPYLTLQNMKLNGNQCALGHGGFVAVVEATDCDFSRNGLLQNGGALTHNIYGGWRRATFTNCISIAPREGYALKFRGQEPIIDGGRWKSGPNAKPFDFPDGTTAVARISNAIIEKDAGDGDHGILEYGEESASNGLAGVLISGGSIAALCDNPFVGGTGGTITLHGVATSGNPITAQGGVKLVVE